MEDTSVVTCPTYRVALIKCSLMSIFIANGIRYDVTAIDKTLLLVVLWYIENHTWSNETWLVAS